MKVRFADIKDNDKLVKVIFDYFAAENYDISDDMGAMIKSKLVEYYKKHLNDDLFIALVEDDDGNIASSAFLAITEMPASLSCPTGIYGKIFNVLTYPRYRKKGYATAALNLLIEEAKKRKLSYIEISASEMGRPVYKKLGFQEKNDIRYMKLLLYK